MLIRRSGRCFLIGTVDLDPLKAAETRNTVKFLVNFRKVKVIAEKVATVPRRASARGPGDFAQERNDHLGKDAENSDVVDGQLYLEALSRIFDMETECARLESAKSEAEADARDWKDRFEAEERSSEEALSESRARCKHIEAMNEQLRSKVDLLEQQDSFASETISSIQAQLDSAVTVSQDDKRMIVQLEEQLIASDTTAQHRQHTSEELQSRCDELQRQLGASRKASSPLQCREAPSTSHSEAISDIDHGEHDRLRARKLDTQLKRTLEELRKANDTLEQRKLALSVSCFFGGFSH